MSNIDIAIPGRDKIYGLRKRQLQDKERHYIKVSAQRFGLKMATVEVLMRGPTSIVEAEFSLSTNSYVADENSSIAFTIVRVGDTTSIVDIDWLVSGITGMSLTSGTTRFNVGITSVVINVTTIEVSSTEIGTLSILNPQLVSGIAINSVKDPFSAAVTINDTAPVSGDFFVAKNGNDSNSGTEALPFLTIGKGLSSLSSGETLIIKAGVYTDDFIGQQGVMPPSGGGSFGAATTIKANPGDVVQLKSTGPESAFNKAVHFGSNSSYIIVDGLILGNDSSSERYFSDCAKIDGTSHHIRIINNEIRFSFNQGCLVANTTDVGAHEFLSNDFHDNGSSARGNQVHGLYFGHCTNSKVWNNDFHNNQAYGHQLWSSDGVTNNDNDIQYNRFWDQKIRAGMTMNGLRNLIANNIIWNNGRLQSGNGGGIDMVTATNSTGNKIFHNTVYSNFGPAMRIFGSNNLVKNNIDYLNVSGITDSNNANDLSNNHTANPNFVDAANGDFHLQSSSSARNFGTNLLVDVPDDFDKIARDTAPDAGALEFVP